METLNFKQMILKQFLSRDCKYATAKPVYINGIRYRSIFEAGIDSELSFPTISIKLKNSKGAPCLTGKKHVELVSEEWIEHHPEYLLGEG